MEQLAVNSFHPDHLILYISGKLGLNKEPLTVITNMIEQNALILAYEKPITVKAISEMLGISMVFAEEAVEKLVANELMNSLGSKVYTNFPIINEEFMQNIQNTQKEYVDKTFGKSRTVFDDLVKEYEKLNIFNKYSDVQLYLNSLYSMFHCVYIYLTDVYKSLKVEDYPERKNSGKWIIDFGYKRNRIDKEAFRIPHRLEAKFNTSSSYEVFVEIRDTFRSVSPWHTINGINSHDVGELLYYINKGEKYDHLKTFLFPDLTRLGYVTKNGDGVYNSSIPVIPHVEYEKVLELNDKYSKIYIELFKDELMEMVESNVIKYPKLVNPVSGLAQQISLHAIALTYAEKATEEGIISLNKTTNCPVAIIVEKSI